MRPPNRLPDCCWLAGRIALAVWIRRSPADVWRLGAHLVGPAQADHLTQEAYPRADRALPGFRGDASARTWLPAIARRTCADAIRRTQRARAPRRNPALTPSGQRPQRRG